MYIIMNTSSREVTPRAFVSVIAAEKRLKCRKCQITWLIDEYGHAPTGSVILQGQKGGTVYNVVKIDVFDDAEREWVLNSILCDLPSLSAYDLHLLSVFADTMFRRVTGGGADRG